MPRTTSSRQALLLLTATGGTVDTSIEVARMRSDHADYAELLASGVREDGWTYVVLSELSGTSLTRVWHDCSHRERAAMLERIGAPVDRFGDSTGKFEAIA